MRLYNLAVALAFFAPAIAAPANLIAVEKYDGETSGKHIVTLKPGVDQSLFLDGTNLITTHNWTVVNGFAGQFSEDQIHALRAHRDVYSIAEDGIAQTSLITTQSGSSIPPMEMFAKTLHRIDAPWGLARLSSVKKLTNQNPASRNFRFVHDTTAGLGVDIYVIDTGKKFYNCQKTGFLIKILQGVYLQHVSLEA
ncbi:hypothetical protein C0992_005921 [Termitomyces sp. T32_za158]|nr:hypothetical protein C0992_005921 [Termitomyces sp. T32_za158]